MVAAGRKVGIALASCSFALRPSRGKAPSRSHAVFCNAVKAGVSGSVEDRVRVDAIGSGKIDIARFAEAVHAKRTIVWPATAHSQDSVAEWNSPTVTSAAPPRRS